ncbi:acetyl-CoA carboxylase, carboxyl transferase subunit alpha [Fructilactobacillus fructivorans]|nr:acetyl-CoA carboxylase, carboxyl transferase subunit alpha [Fructilactobacillus fructivorans]
MQLTVPYISVIVGEGGSGGALALAVGDCVWAFEDSIYSVLSPEGYATILWKDPSRMKEAASVMKLTPDELLSEGIIDRIIPEVNTVDGFERFRGDLVKKIKELNAMSKDEMLQKRLARYRNF